MNLIQRANKDAARQAMRGTKRAMARLKSPKGQHKYKRPSKNQHGAWEMFTRKLFGAWAQEPVVIRDEKTKAAVEALYCKFEEPLIFIVEVHDMVLPQTASDFYHHSFVQLWQQ